VLVDEPVEVLLVSHTETNGTGVGVGVLVAVGVTVGVVVGEIGRASCRERVCYSV
jgi:hypothetical protein